MSRITYNSLIRPVDSLFSALSEQAQALFEGANEGLLALDADGVALLANRVARDKLGVPSGTVLPKRMPELWGRIAATRPGGQRRLEVPVEVDGLQYLVRISPVLVEGELAGWACVFEESGKAATVEAMAEEMRAYQDLTRELDAIIDSSSDGLWICDAEAKVIRINRASERINSIKAEEVVGRTMTELVAQGFVDRSVTAQVLETGKVVDMLQQRGDRKLILTGTPVFDAHGKLIRVVVSERDITEIDTLQRTLEEQEAIKDQFRNQMLEMQQMVIESRRIIAKSPCMIKALRQALKVGGANSSVLILGESGVGKGLIADLIHKNSSRAEMPMIKINCGAIPESLIESELFGYEKGAFTGAQTSKPGHLETADGGIVFLDEIAELPLPSQVKLLRFLEDGRILRLGGTKPRTVDVRVLAATHRNLEEMIEAGKFRLDLFYRLNVIPLYVPAVRERRDCIPALLHYYIDYFASQSGTRKRLTRAASDALLNYRFPGNVRELMNICERLVVMTDTELIDLQDLPSHIANQAQDALLAAGDWPEAMTLQQILDSVERSVLERAAEKFGTQYKIAKMLGVNQSTIARKLKKFGIG